MTATLRFTSVFLSCLLLAATSSAKWKYFRAGNAADSEAIPRAGFALMGGGEHLEAGYQFLCERANQGDFLILRANTEDDYAQQVNKDISAICPVNSMATIVFSDR